MGGSVGEVEGDGDVPDAVAETGRHVGLEVDGGNATMLHLNELPI